MDGAQHRRRHADTEVKGFIMNQENFQELDTIASIMSEKFQNLRESGALKEIEDGITELAQKLQERYSISLLLTLSIFDSERDNEIKIHETGINCFGKDSPHSVDGGDSYQRFVVTGNIVELPNGYCPSCWGEWDFKLFNPECPHCKIKLGVEVKLLLDTNECPHCCKGVISMNNPQCTHCDFVALPEIVSWG